MVIGSNWSSCQQVIGGPAGRWAHGIFKSLPHCPSQSAVPGAPRSAWLEVAVDRRYLNTDEAGDLTRRLDKIGRMLNVMMQKADNFRTHR